MVELNRGNEPVTTASSELVARAQLGDMGAYGLLYEKHYPNIFRYCRRITRSDDHAEELASITFLKGLASIRSYSGEGSFVAWLNSIATNSHITSERRNRKTSNSIYIDDVAGEITKYQEHFPDPYLNGQLNEALSSLTEDQKNAVWLTEVEGYSGAEAAEQLGVNPNALRARKFRGLKALRERLHHVYYETESPLTAGVAVTIASSNPELFS